MKNRIGFLKKDIKRNIGKFVAILIITALSVGFLTGLASIAPDMEYTADKYYDTSNFWDINIKSTLGFTHEDIEAIRQQEYIEDVRGVITLDATASHNLEGNYPIRIYAVDFDNDIAAENALAAPILLKGSYPINSTSCVVVRSYALKNDIEIGDKIYLTSRGDIFSEIAFTVTGIAESAEFASFDKQSGNSGDSAISIAMYVSKSIYPDVGIYTDVVATVKGADKLDAFSEKYNKKIAAAKQKLEKLSIEREKLREDSITSQQQSALGQVTSNFTEYQQNTYSQLAAQKQYVNRLKKDIEKAAKDIKAKREKLIATKDGLDLQAPEIEALKLKGDTATAEEKAKIGKYNKALAKYNKDLKALTKKENVLKVDKTIYEQAKKSYHKNLKQANKELANAQNKYEEYKGQEQSVGKQSWSIADRTQNAAFLGFTSNIDKINAIARVFPIILFIVALFVVAVTINQTVNEQRGEIGILRSIGYTDKMIIKKNVNYSLFVATLGIVLGVIIGILVLPMLIYSTYGAMYSYGALRVLIIPKAIIPSVLLALLGVVGAGYIFTKKSLKEKPAALVLSRPASNSKGAFFDRLEKLCSRLKSSVKTTLRGVIRSPKRFIVTAVAIAGCTALLLTGFGLKDSVADVSHLQYDGIQKYDASLTLKNNVNFDEAQGIKKLLNNKEYVQNYAPVYNGLLTYNNDGDKISVTVMVPQDEKAFNKLISLKKGAFGKEIALKDKGIVLSENFASANGIKTGDSVSLITASGVQVKFKVGAIAENYVDNIIYMSPAAFKKVFGNDAVTNGVLVSLANGITNDKFDQVSKGNGLIRSVIYSADRADYINQKLSSTAHIITFLIIAAILMTIMVVYVLTDINLSTKKRKIGVIKLLGLTSREGITHIYGETVFSAIIGIAAGLLLGVLLHFAIVNGHNILDVMLGRRISLVAFAAAIGISAASVVLCAVTVLLKIIKTDIKELDK